MERAISMIHDSSLRSILRAGQSELARIKSENDMLRKAFKSLSLPPTHQKPASQAGAGEVEYIPADGAEAGEFRLKPSQAKALKKGMDKDRLAERGLSIRDDGAIADEQGIALFPPGFATAILALLEEQ